MLVIVVLAKKEERIKVQQKHDPRGYCGTHQKTVMSNNEFEAYKSNEEANASSGGDAFDVPSTDGTFSWLGPIGDGVQALRDCDHPDEQGFENVYFVNSTN